MLSILLIALPTFFSEQSEAAPNEPAAREHLVFVAYPGAMLERRSGDRWVLACADSCERDLTIDDDVVGVDYRIRDLRGRTSSRFAITGARGERVIVTARLPSDTVKEAGVITTTVGILGFVASVVAVVLVSAGNVFCGQRDFT
ncbi:MAG: hypothetical protein ACRELY_30935, partial [Polyangiaceae bacterium]